MNSELAAAIDLAEKVACEDAERDLKFAGDDTLKYMLPDAEQRAKVREALIWYAKTGAVRAVRALALHGKLANVY